SSLILWLFLQLDRYLSTLHSFPTRRSSDLQLTVGALQTVREMSAPSRCPLVTEEKPWRHQEQSSAPPHLRWPERPSSPSLRVREAEGPNTRSSAFSSTPRTTRSPRC